jgi:hypothetical protein
MLLSAKFGLDQKFDFHRGRMNLLSGEETYDLWKAYIHELLNLYSLFKIKSS